MREPLGRAAGRLRARGALLLMLLCLGACSHRVLLSTALQLYREDAHLVQPPLLAQRGYTSVSRYLLRRKDSLLLDSARFTGGYLTARQSVRLERAGHPVRVERVAYAYNAPTRRPGYTQWDFTQTAAVAPYRPTRAAAQPVRHLTGYLRHAATAHRTLWVMRKWRVAGDTVESAHTLAYDTAAWAPHGGRLFNSIANGNQARCQSFRVYNWRTQPLPAPVPWLDFAASLTFCPDSAPGFPNPPSTIDPWGCFTLGMDYRYLPLPDGARLLVERGFLTNGAGPSRMSRDSAVYKAYAPAGVPSDQRLAAMFLFVCLQQQVNGQPVAEQYFIRRHRVRPWLLRWSQNQRRNPFILKAGYDEYRTVYRYH